MLAESQLKILSRCVAARLCTFFQDGSNAWHGGTPRDKIHPCPRIRSSVPLWERKESWKSIRASIFPNFICPSQCSLGFAVTIWWWEVWSMRKGDRLNLSGWQHKALFHLFSQASCDDKYILYSSNFKVLSYLIAFTSSTLFLCPVCICWMGVDTGQGTASWCRESVRVGSSHAQQCSMFYNTPCVQHSWAVMFSVTQEELFPMAMDETLGSWVDIILSVVHFLTCCEQQQIHVFLSFMQRESN